MQALMDAVNDHINLHRTEGRDWPSDATHCVVTRTQAWPCGMGERNVTFYTSRFAALRRIVKLYRWADLENNHFQATIYEWDLGPNLVHSFHA